MQYIKLDTAAKYAETKMREQFTKHHYETKMSFPEIEWKSLGKNCAGYATANTNTVTLNSDYLTSPSFNDFLNETPLHELAHLVAFKLHGSHGHDRAWRNVCYAFGLLGNRCHSFATPENAKIRKPRKAAVTHTVYCRCCTHEISDIRYKRLLAGESYICNKCRTRITLSPTI